MCDKINKEVLAPLNVSHFRSRGFALAQCPVPQHWHTPFLGSGGCFLLGWQKVPGLESTLRARRCLRQLRSYLWETAHTAERRMKSSFTNLGLVWGRA